MPNLNFELRSSSPIFMQGSSPRGQPEFRAASIRGQLRYWFRAMKGAQVNNLQQVWNAEEKIFGSTERGSTVMVRTSPLVPRNNKKYPLLPHRPTDDKRRSPTLAISPETLLTLSFVTRPGVIFSKDFSLSLSLWLLLGGVGKRSRRMAGGFDLLKAKADSDVYLEDWWQNPPNDIDVYGQIISELLRGTLNGVDPRRDMPSFPILHPDHSWIIVGQDAFTDYEEPNCKLFHKLLRGKYRQQEDYFGYTRGGRRASPFVAQVRQIGREYYPVFTFMRSSPALPRHQKLDWNIINDFHDDLTNTFNGNLVWGGKFS